MISLRNYKKEKGFITQERIMNEKGDWEKERKVHQTI